MNYLFVKITTPRGSARLNSIDNVPKRHELDFGIPRAAGFPADASFKMHEDFPKDLRLNDAMFNVSALLVVSKRFKEALEAIPGALWNNEILPVKIINHKGRIEDAPYFIIHHIHNPDCLDEEQCEGVRSKIQPTMFQFLSKMVLDEKKIDPRAQLFRPAHFPEVSLISRTLADELRKQNFVGVEFCEIEGYDF